eukprot:TRINITY_DN4238_c0_g2_i13.p1 TRINITY_DN4238_c0_g2~~TRINITY_DN4238_c0_g2_i13.p1  ORF type:complete len:450 (+),score=77.43 TRINITY_DN4238_c0_g2_i13:75-1424(+)
MRRRGHTARVVPNRTYSRTDPCSTHIFFPSFGLEAEYKVETVCKPQSKVGDVLEAECHSRSLKLKSFTITDSRGIPISPDCLLGDIEDHQIILHVCDTNLVEVLCAACWNGELNEVQGMLHKPEFLHVINNINKRGQTPLFCAARRGHLKIVIALLEHDIDVDVQVVEHGGTPLHGACFGGHKEVIAALLIAGANPHIENLVGLSAIQEATGEACSVFLLVEKPFGALEKLQSIHPDLIKIKPKRLMTHTEAQKKDMRGEQILKLKQNELMKLSSSLLFFYRANSIKMVFECKKNILTVGISEECSRTTNRVLVFNQLININKNIFNELDRFSTFVNILRGAGFFEMVSKIDTSCMHDHTQPFLDFMLSSATFHSHISFITDFNVGSFVGTVLNAIPEASIFMEYMIFVTNLSVASFEHFNENNSWIDFLPEGRVFNCLSLVKFHCWVW